MCEQQVQGPEIEGRGEAGAYLQSRVPSRLVVGQAQRNVKEWQESEG